MWLRPHTVSNTNSNFKFKHTPIQTYFLFVQVNTTPFPKHKRTAVIAIVVYLDSTSGWDYNLILNRIRVKDSNSIRHQYKLTCWLSEKGNTNTTPWNTFSEHKWTVVIDIVVCFFNTSGWDYDYDLILHRTRILILNSNTRQYKHTSCVWGAKTTPCHTFNEHKHTVVIAIVVYLHDKWGWDYDLILHWTRITGQIQVYQYKRTG